MPDPLHGCIGTVAHSGAGGYNSGSRAHTPELGTTSYDGVGQRQQHDLQDCPAVLDKGAVFTLTLTALASVLCGEPAGLPKPRNIYNPLPVRYQKWGMITFFTHCVPRAPHTPQMLALQGVSVKTVPSPRAAV